MKHVFPFCSFAVICREMQPWCALVTCNNYVASAVSPECAPGLRLSRTGPSEEPSCSLKGTRLWSWNPSSYQESIWAGPLRVLYNVFRNLSRKGDSVFRGLCSLTLPFAPPFLLLSSFFLLGLILSIHWTCILMTSSHGLMFLWHHHSSVSELCWFSC